MQRIFSLRRSCSKVKPSLLRLGEYKYGENYDPKRAEPDTESPYFGNPNNLPEDMDLMWDNDGFQKEWIMNRTAEHIPHDKLWLQLFYLLGFWFGGYQLYCMFIRMKIINLHKNLGNAEPTHPVTNVTLSRKDFDKVQEAREKRLAQMEKHNISE